MLTLTSNLPQTDFGGKRVFLRADLNVPLCDEKILSDLRLQALLPTIAMIQKNNGKIILATHIDRPTEYDAALSTQVLLPWLEKQDYTIDFEPNLAKAFTKSSQNPKTILLLDNLRFFPGEQSNDPEFTHELRRLSDYYVNDAFGMIHRTDSSLVALPKLFAPNYRMIGLLVEKEIAHANRLLKPERPFALIIGGNKISEKIPMIEHLLSTIDYLLLCPALVFSFLKAQNLPVGSSLIDSHSLQICKNIIANAAKNNIKVVLPIDYLVNSKAMSGPYQIKKAANLSQDDYGVAIGPETEKLFASIILQSKTSFYNGLSGDLRYAQTLHGCKAIFEAMVNSKGYCVVGGGDSSAAAQREGYQEKMSFLSTGGGALIAYLSNQKLPALDVLLNK